MLWLLVNMYWCQKNAGLLEYCPTLEVCTSYIYSSTFPLTMVCQFFKFWHPILPQFSFSNLDGFLSLKCLILVHFLLLLGIFLTFWSTNINLFPNLHIVFFLSRKNFFLELLLGFYISIWGFYKMMYTNSLLFGSCGDSNVKFFK